MGGVGEVEVDVCVCACVRPSMRACVDISFFVVVFFF